MASRTGTSALLSDELDGPSLQGRRIRACRRHRGSLEENRHRREVNSGWGLVVTKPPAPSESANSGEQAPRQEPAAVPRSVPSIRPCSSTNRSLDCGTSGPPVLTRPMWATSVAVSGIPRQVAYTRSAGRRWEVGREHHVAAARTRPGSRAGCAVHSVREFARTSRQVRAASARYRALRVRDVDRCIRRSSPVRAVVLLFVGCNATQFLAAMRSMPCGWPRRPAERRRTSRGVVGSDGIEHDQVRVVIAQVGVLALAQAPVVRGDPMTVGLQSGSRPSGPLPPLPRPPPAAASSASRARRHQASTVIQIRSVKPAGAPDM